MDELTPKPIDGLVEEQELDLTTKEGVRAFMEASTSPTDWDLRYEKLNKMHDGHMPPFWANLIEAEGLARKMIEKWKKLST